MSRSPSLRSAPPRDDFLDLTLDLKTRARSIVARGQQVIVASFRVAHMSDDGQEDRLLVQGLRGGGSSDATAVLSAGVLRDDGFPTRRAPGKARAYLSREPFDVLVVQLRLARGSTLALTLPRLTVLEALLFRLLERRGFDEKSLTLVALASAAPLQDDGPQLRVLFRTPSQRRVAPGEKDQMVEIRTGQAQRDLVSGQRNPRSPTEFLTACVTL